MQIYEVYWHLCAGSDLSMVLGLNGRPYKLGCGSYGDVYMVDHVKTGKRAALKLFLSGTSQELDAALREASIAVVAGKRKYAPKCFGVMMIESEDETYLPLAMVTEYIGEADVKQTGTFLDLLKNEQLTDITWMDLCYQVGTISLYEQYNIALPPQGSHPTFIFQHSLQFPIKPNCYPLALIICSKLMSGIIDTLQTTQTRGVQPRNSLFRGCVHFHCSSPSQCVPNQWPTNQNVSSLSIICHCLSSPLSIIPQCLWFPLLIHHCMSMSTVCHSPLYVIHYCMSFPIVCHIPLYVIPHCMSYPTVFHSPLYVIPHCLSFTIVCHSTLSIIPHCLLFPIVCHPLPMLLSIIHHCVNGETYKLLPGSYMCFVCCDHMISCMLGQVYYCKVMNEEW